MKSILKYVRSDSDMTLELISKYKSINENNLDDLHTQRTARANVI